MLKGLIAQNTKKENRKSGPNKNKFNSISATKIKYKKTKRKMETQKKIKHFSPFV